MYYYKKKFNKNFIVFIYSFMYVFGIGIIKVVDIIWICFFILIRIVGIFIDICKNVIIGKGENLFEFVWLMLNLVESWKIWFLYIKIIIICKFDY